MSKHEDTPVACIYCGESETKGPCSSKLAEGYTMPCCYLPRARIRGVPVTDQGDRTKVTLVARGRRWAQVERALGEGRPSRDGAASLVDALCSEIERLRAENAELRRTVEHQQRFLVVRQAQEAAATSGIPADALRSLVDQWMSCDKGRKTKADLSIYVTYRRCAEELTDAIAVATGAAPNGGDET